MVLNKCFENLCLRMLSYKYLSINMYLVLYLVANEFRKPNGLIGMGNYNSIEFPNCFFHFLVFQFINYANKRVQ